MEMSCTRFGFQLQLFAPGTRSPSQTDRLPLVGRSLEASPLLRRWSCYSLLSSPAPYTQPSPARPVPSPAFLSSLRESSIRPEPLPPQQGKTCPPRPPFTN